jgi:NAD(P)-dependent dehydrogenase (short-subunit alcohol dehydrogenase family)
MSRDGVRCALCDIDLEPATGAPATLPGARAYRVDVTDYAAVEAATHKVLQDYGRIDILLNSAGAKGPIAPPVDYPLDAWRQLIWLNLDGVFHGCRAVGRVMIERDRGRIVNMSSIGGKQGNAGASCYAAAKAGAIALTRAFGKELALTGIGVHCVAPAGIDTEILDQVTPEFGGGRGREDSDGPARPPRGGSALGELAGLG